MNLEEFTSPYFIKMKIAPSGNRTRAALVRGDYAYTLDHGGFDISKELVDYY